MKKLFVVMTLSFAASAFAEGWDRYNNPNIYVPIMPNKSINYNFAKLPLEADLENKGALGWSGNYWPFMYGGITYRWNQPGFKPFTNKFPTREEILTMSQEKMGELSPAELYDIYRGDYNFTFTKRLLSMHNPKAQWWEGLCDGWALSAANYAEPKAVVMTNKDGVKVPFGSSDVKALMSMHGVYNSQGYYVKVGRRCNAVGKVAGEGMNGDRSVVPPSPRKAESDGCRDVNAGAFHVVLTNMLGVHGRSVVADVDRFADVWNQTITAYDSKVVGNEVVNKDDQRRGIVQKVRVKTRMQYSEELMFYSKRAAELGYTNFESKSPVIGTPSQAHEHRDYEYILELDVNGNIIGGEWITETRPDMMWTKEKDVRFNDSKFPLSGLNEIYRPVDHK